MLMLILMMMIVMCTPREWSWYLDKDFFVGTPRFYRL